MKPWLYLALRIIPDPLGVGSRVQIILTGSKEWRSVKVPSNEERHGINWGDAASKHKGGIGLPEQLGQPYFA